LDGNSNPKRSLSAMETYRLTNKQIERFVKSLHKYVYDFWHLSEWDIQVVINEEEVNAYGTLCADMENGMALFTVHRHWKGLKPTKVDIDRIAFHEASELLMWEFQTLATSRYISEESINIARHKVITTMENRIYKGFDI
jgi:hypothetical protein